MPCLAEIDASYGLCCVIGDPIAHSLSPQIQNAALKAKGIRCIYLAFRVRSEELAAFMEALPLFPIRGLNVTIPHKTAIMKHLDELDGDARAIGSVNVVVVKNEGDRKKLVGYNTDAKGFLNPLLRRGWSPKGVRCLLLGAGGAARACAYSLWRAGASKLIIAARNQEKANSLVKELGLDGGHQVIGFSMEELLAAAKECELIVNATPLGMEGYPGRLEMPEEAFSEVKVVYDLVYRPHLTPFLKRAAVRGAKIVPGYEMLVEQAALSFELWWGQEAPRSIMLQTAKRALGLEA